MDTMKVEEVIQQLAVKSAQATPSEALHYSQAALNLMHVLHLLKNLHKD